MGTRLPYKRMIVGETYGGNLVLARVGTKGIMPQFLVRCRCGVERVVGSNSIRRSGGCKKCYGVAKRKDGATRRLDEPAYAPWQAMRDRCNPGNKCSKYWAGRGVTICQEWADFDSFKVWAYASGYRKGLSLDRINPRGNYEPSNCEWVTRAENSRRAFQLWRRDTHFPIEMFWGVC